MPRLFTALTLPAPLSCHLASLREGLPGGRFIEPGDYHITLRFMGDVDYRLANDIDDRLSSLAFKPFELRLHQLDCFGKDSPHSLVALVQLTPALGALQADHERLMQRLGLSPEPRKFTPHVTLARLKNRQVSFDQVGRWIVEHSPLPGAAFAVDSFALMSSKASTGGGPYVIEKIYQAV